MRKLTILSFVFALLFSASGAINAEAATTIKIAHPNVPIHPEAQAFELFKKELEKRSNGEFKVVIYDSSKYGNHDAVLQGLTMGVLQMGADSPANFSVFSEKLITFDLPFLFSSYEHADKIINGKIGAELGQTLEKNGVTCLGYFEIGFRQIFSNRPIRSLEDAKDLKIRATAAKTHLAFLQSVGMNPTPIAWGEVYTTLQQKTVDGVDIDLNLGYFNKFHETTPYVTLTNSVYCPHLVLINTKFWNKLTDQERQWIKESFDVAKAFNIKTNRENEAKIIEKMKSEGVEVIELTPEERQRWIDASKGVYDKFKDTVDMEKVTEIQNLK